VTEFARGTDVDCPNGITVGPDGALYVTSFNNGHVVRVDGTGRVTRFATVPGGRNAHIAFAAGAFWVTKIETHIIYRLGLDGSVRRHAGTGTSGFDDGPVAQATLAHPNGIAAIPGGKALVVNTLEGVWRGDEATRIVLRRVELPAHAPALQRITIAVGNMVFDALAAGPDDGELVLLLHGFPQTGLAFSAQLRALGTAGYRAVAPDQRGYSAGARPRVREEYVMGNFVADVAGMADALGHERFHLVGHDWGGAVAWVMATRFPNRVRSLTVLSTPHFGALGAQRADPASDQAERSSYFVRFGEPGAEEWFLADDKAVFREVLSGVPEHHREVYLSRLGNPEAMRAALAWYHVFARPIGPAPTGQTPSPTPPSVAPVRVPTLYVWGTDDGAFGWVAAEKTADFVAGPYEFHALEGIGHWVPELAPDTVSHLLLRHLRGKRATSVEALENYRAARDALRSAIDALGGVQAVLGFENLTAAYRTTGLARGQSRRPGPPFDATEASGHIVYEADGRLYYEEGFVNEGGTDRSYRRALLEDGSWNLWIARDLLSTIAPSDVAFLRARPNLNPEKAFPHSLLRAALRNAACAAAHPHQLHGAGWRGDDPSY
jgi:pimeloyl-ACP methyl ester carboxylesterase